MILELKFGSSRRSLVCEMASRLYVTLDQNVELEIGWRAGRSGNRCIEPVGRADRLYVMLDQHAVLSFRSPVVDIKSLRELKICVAFV